MIQFRTFRLSFEAFKFTGVEKKYFFEGFNKTSIQLSPIYFYFTNVTSGIGIILVIKDSDMIPFGIFRSSLEPFILFLLCFEK